MKARALGEGLPRLFLFAPRVPSCDNIPSREGIERTRNRGKPEDKLVEKRKREKKRTSIVEG
jgi:hypothetical protein